MRGKVFFASVCVDFSGITPAHAGKSVRVRGLPAGREDHPRTCGEKRSRASSGKVNLGSPPHMRGKVSDLREGAASHRDHPRTCGEKPALWLLVALLWGSPPHMRGKGPLFVVFCTLCRITPAHAGKRLKRSRSTVPHAAIVPLFPSVCNKPAGSDGSPAGHDAPPFLPIENAAPASPAYNLRSL